jgi:hypothetical protein
MDFYGYTIYTMNNDHLSLQKPDLNCPDYVVGQSGGSAKLNDELNNKVSSFSSIADTPVLNPNPIRTEDTAVVGSSAKLNNSHYAPLLVGGLRKNKNINLSVEIPRWRTFNETNNEIPTMDASPMYAKNSPTKGELFSQAELPDFRSRKNYTQNPIVSEKRNGTNNTNHIDESYPHNDRNSNESFLIRCYEYIFSWFT